MKNISQWFITFEELAKIDDPYVLNVTNDVTNDLETDANENFWKFRSIEEIRETLTNKYCISQERFVVLYTRVELMAASRVAWLLYWLGYEQIRILLGHVEPVCTRPSTSPPANVPLIPRRPSVVLTCSQLREAFRCSNTRFIDVRTWEEYSGQITGYPFVRYPGRIARFEFDPLNGIYGDIPGNVTREQLAEYLQLMSRTTFRQAGIERLVYMCGTGWRASLSAIFADILQLAPVITLLDSGWYEWSERSRL
jgi:molybdopterin synthase sulfurtransferase